MPGSAKSPGESLSEQLLLKRKNTALTLSEELISAAYTYAEEYKAFLDAAKTEREAITRAVSDARRKGFTPFEPGKRYAPGDKIYYINRDKAVILAVVGARPLNEQVRMAVAHVDVPRIDLKPLPLYEDAELALLKTHYYGGIKKYQWTAIPLALHGRVVKKDLSIVDLVIGEQPGDPVFTITDLLPHLSTEQMKRTMAEGIRGEDLNALVGSHSFKDDKAGGLVKLNVLRLLHEAYGLTEADFVSAELSLVPAFPARDVGFDRSLVGGYGQDDRVCSYTTYTALLDAGPLPYTSLAILTDKEEVGSDGNTGLQSSYLHDFLAALAKPYGLSPWEVFGASVCLSADVNAAFDPIYPDVMEKYNCAHVNYGVIVTKYTGSRGKSGTSDASAELMGRIRYVMDTHSIPWQTGELGKVDAGGGGTVSMYVAALNADVVDIGVPVLSMHAPFEVVSKLDIHTAYRAFGAFFGHAEKV